VALGIGRLLTTYVTSFYTNHNWKIDDLGELEIVEVAYGGLATGRGVIWLGIGFWVSMLRVEIGNSLDFLWVFFSTFRYYRYNRRYWLLLEFVDVSMGIINLKDKVMNLLLEELDNCVMLSDYGITLIDLILPVKNGLLTRCDNFPLLGDQGLKLFYLSDLSISISIVTLSYTSQLTHTTA
jgi:hypothetical protein